MHPTPSMALVSFRTFIDDGLGATAVFPAIADPEREEGVRVGRAPRVVEERRIEVRIVALLAQGPAGVEASLALPATQLVGLLARRAGLAGAPAPPLVVRDVDALRLGDEEIVFHLALASPEQGRGRGRAEPVLCERGPGPEHQAYPACEREPAAVIFRAPAVVGPVPRISSAHRVSPLVSVVLPSSLPRPGRRVDARSGVESRAPTTARPLAV